VPPHLRALPCLAPPLHWRKGGSGIAERSRGHGGGEKGERARRGDTREEACSEREEARCENGCRRHMIHFCVAWEARLKMGSEDRYSVGDVSVSYSAVLETYFVL
jgi:hypothetical protein